ncbi:LPXTG cell wall anchor domain-containing protein [Aeromicrobium sp.]|uniref:LPXTG cell wall anchor domain-containing protein n=1 Tax=Aeromicrobium sp. TaxID=1871063 RepID=UPI0028AAC439|nr:LPXTG cell wall anchor domain-containing protein [Aeromicrobium sp.]
MRRLVATVLALGLVLVGVTPASAADQIGLSLDGTHWADTLEDSLFDPDVVWVPGDSHTVSFYVRNQADTNAVLSAAVLSGDGDHLLAGKHVSLRARAGGQWFPLVNGHPSPELTAASITPGEQVRVDVEAAFDPASSNASQSAALDVMLRVRLADAAASIDPEPGGSTPTDPPTDRPTEPTPSDDPSDSDGIHDSDDGRDRTEGGADHLPSTGSETPVILIWMAVLAITAGAAFLAAGRREREHEHA